MKRLLTVAVLALATTLATACTPSDDGSDPVLEDGQVQPGEQ
jgi:hypothetical protein